MTILAEEIVELFFNELNELIHNASFNKTTRLQQMSDILDRFLKALTQKETDIFANLRARTIFVVEHYLAPQELGMEMHGLRILADKAAFSSDFEVTEDMQKAAVKALALVIHYFSALPIPEKILSIYKGIPNLSLQQQGIKPKIRIPYVQAVVTHVGEVQKTDKGYTYCILSCQSDDMGKFKVVIRDIPKGEGFMNQKTLGKQLILMAHLAWKYATINFFHLQKIEKRENFYTTTLQSQIVLEPDYLVDSTEIAGCFQSQGANPLLVVLNKFSAGETSPAMLSGTIVNDCLDELIRDIDNPLETIFAESLKKNTLAAARFGMDTMNQVKRTIKEAHFGNLKRIARAYRKLKIRIEPTFFSARYGLQGRLDVLIERENNAFRKDVFELKSGSSPSNGVWVNHRMQVICYNLLLKSVFSEKKQGASAIFYSKAIQDHLRVVKNYPQWEQDALMCRNYLVALVYQLSIGNNNVFKKINPAKFGLCPPFKTEEVADFAVTYGEASDLEKAYFEAFTAFIFRELRTAKVGSDQNFYTNNDDGFAALWKHSLLQKTGGYNILYGLELVNMEVKEGNITFKKTNEVIANFRQGDIAIIYPQTSEVLEPLKYQIFKCFITKLDNEEITIQLRNRQVATDFFSSYDLWALEHDFMESGFTALSRSLFHFLKAKKSQRNLILGLKAPVSNPLADVVLPLPTPNQKRIIAKAVAAKDYFLLQGPPGTGKTFTLVQILKLIYEYTHETIAVLAFTNRAVNEICDKMEAAELPFIRLGSGGRKDKAYNLRHIIDENTLTETTEILQKNRIFATTVAAFLTRQNDLLGIRKFDTLIVDEASQLLEPHLAGVLPHFKRFILIGDQNQLPAVITQKETNCLIDNAHLADIQMTDLRVSLFERLFNNAQQKEWTHAYDTLTEHFRMHEDIAALVNHYYKGRLTAMTAMQKKPLTLYNPTSDDPWERLLARSRTVFINSEKEVQSKRHDGEADLVHTLVHTIKRVFAENFTGETVGVITPWRAQIANIQSRLEPDLLDKVAVDTVERFQGSERSIIIVSLAVYHPGQVQSLQSLSPDGLVDRKLNVAVSRAKQQVIFLGYPPAFASNVHYGRLLRALKQ